MPDQADSLQCWIGRRAARKRKQRSSRIAVGVIAGILFLLAVPRALPGPYPGDAPASLSDAPLALVALAAPVAVVDDFRPDPATYKVPILMYHDIGYPAAVLTVTPEMLEQQLTALEAGGYLPVSMDALLLAMRGEEVHLPHKGVAITFDDGYAGVYRQAYPILKKHGFTATLYVVTGLVEMQGYVDWEQIREMESDGWTVGSHTVRHLDLRVLSGKGVADEIGLARAVLRENTGQPILSFCYPSGKYSELVVEAVKSAGYFGAVTTEPGTATLLDAPFALKRVRIDGRESLGQFKARLSLP